MLLSPVALKLEMIHVDPENTSYTDVDGILFTKSRDKLIRYLQGADRYFYTIPDNVTKIGPCAFQDCKKLLSIVIPEHVTNIGDDGSKWGAFAGCIDLTVTVKRGSYAEWYCKVQDIRYTYAEPEDARPEIQASAVIEKGIIRAAGGGKITWRFFANGTLTIIGSGGIKHYGYTDDSGNYYIPPWRHLAEKITHLVIEDGITRIGVESLEGLKT